MKSVVTIGRSSHCDIIIPDDSISREHARISVVGSTYVYEDCGKNGSYIGGRFIYGERITVAAGTEILLAGKYPLPWAKVYTLLPLKGSSVSGGETHVVGGMQHSVREYPPVSQPEESLGVGYGILAFLIPLAGWIMYFCWKDKTPKRASQAATLAWIGFGINLLITLAS